MSSAPSGLPFATPDLPGTGGVMRQTDDDFQVDEVLAYTAAGRGDHVFVRIEKRGLSTPQAAERLAQALDISDRDIGWAGMKDKHAVTRQTLSLPPPVTPERVLALDLPGIAIIEANRHPHKLRTGHLRGNLFVLRLRDTAVDADTARERAHAVLTALARRPGSPNWFGEQRFGRHGDNAAIGRALVLGTSMPAGARRPHGRKMRLFISALQSQLFNEYLAERLSRGDYGRVLEGDILRKRDSGGIFVCDDVATDQARLDAGEIVPTGPMFGHEMRSPPEGSPAWERERAILDAHELTADAFTRVKKLGRGTRRELAISLGDIRATTIGERAIELAFELPAGAYATAVLREVVKEPPSNNETQTHEPD